MENRQRDKEVCSSETVNSFYLTYTLMDGSVGAARFETEEDRDGCHISLDLYRVNLGPVDDGVFARMVLRHRGRVLKNGEDRGPDGADGAR